MLVVLYAHRVHMKTKKKKKQMLGTEIAIAEERRDNNMRWRAIMIHDERPQMHRTFDLFYSIVFHMFPLFLLAKGASSNTIKSIVSIAENLSAIEYS